MKAVRGTVTSSKPISLSKAAAMLSDFVDSGICSRMEISPYLRRASTAFDELVGFHSEIKAARRKDDHITPAGDYESRSRKKRKRSEVEAGDPEQIRGSYDANSLPKKRNLASGAKLVEDGGFPSSNKFSASTSPAEKLVENGNAIGFEGRDEKKKKREKEKMREIELAKGHEKEEKKKKKEQRGQP